MNRLDINNAEITNINLDDNISLDYVAQDEFFAVSTINLEIKNDSELRMYFLATDASKLNISINIHPNVKFTLYELKSGSKAKTKYTISLSEGSIINSTKFYITSGMRELDIIDLNGINAECNMHLTTLANNKEKYDILVNHNAKNTKSNIINHGLTKDDGSIIIDVTSVVPRGITGCDVNQKSRIIEGNDELSQINPNLLIDEYDVNAAHSAYIGGFNSEELFYLESRGIKADNARKLLTTGFIKSGINNYMDDKDTKNLLESSGYSE